MFTISELSTDSPFLGEGLAVGMRVLSINRIDITGFDMSMVTAILRNTVGEISIEATLDQEGVEWL